MLFDFAEIDANERYKLLVSTVVPRPIAWITTQSADGTLNAAPYSFFNAFGADPPVLGVGVGRRPEGGLKDSGANIRECGEFVVNLVPEEAATQMNVTAIDFLPGESEFPEAGLTPVPSTHVAPPRLAESPVALECVKLQVVDIGANALVLGRIVALHVRDDAVLDAARHYIDTPKLNLIGRMHGRGWYTRTADQFQIRRIARKDWKAAE